MRSDRSEPEKVRAQKIREAAVIALCMGSALGVAGLAIGGFFALLGGGYDPQDYAGTIDPVRAGLAVFLLTGGGVFGIFGVGALVELVSTRASGSKLEAAESLGIAAACLITPVWALAMAAYAVLGPAEPAPLPSPIRELTLMVGVAFGAAILGGLAKTAAQAVSFAYRALRR